MSGIVLLTAVLAAAAAAGLEVGSEKSSKSLGLDMIHNATYGTRYKIAKCDKGRHEFIAVWKKYVGLRKCTRLTHVASCA